MFYILLNLIILCKGSFLNIIFLVTLITYTENVECHPCSNGNERDEQRSFVTIQVSNISEKGKEMHATCFSRTRATVQHIDDVKHQS